MTGPTSRAMLELLALTDRDRAALTRLRLLAAKELGDLADRTNQQLTERLRDRDSTRSKEQAEALLRTLTTWSAGLLTGSMHEAGVDERSPIGGNPGQASLSPGLILLAMNLLRGNLHRVASEQLASDAHALLDTTLAFDKLLDLELTRTLESFRMGIVQRAQEQERLAEVGQLVAGVSHDLKNPLGVIKTSAMLLSKRLDQLGEDPQLKTLLGRIERGCGQAGALINQLLEYNRIKNPRSRSIPLGPLIEEALSMLEHSAQVQIKVDLEPEDLSINGDPVDLSRVLVNLIGNALQSLGDSDPGKAEAWVLIRAREDQDGVRIEVLDNGPGVPEELRERVFDPLVTTRAHGTGLGLAICRELIEAHGGQLSLEPNPSVGARFVISLPRPPESASE